MDKKIPKMFDGIQEDWKQIILSEEIKPIFIDCLKKVDQDLKLKKNSKFSFEDIDDVLNPTSENILNAFKLTSFANTKVVIIGQDPYWTKTKIVHNNSRTITNRRDAQGLCFSTPAEHKKVTPSLRNIYKALKYSDLINITPKHGCLISWAQQGVLLLNTYLTTTNRALQHEFWALFTIKIIEYISTHKNNVFFLFWGSKARQFEQYITSACDTSSQQSNSCADKIEQPKKHTLLYWVHPSPMASVNRNSNNPKNFMYCDHFTKINQYLISQNHVPINWNPCFPVVVFTDGSCYNNGSANATAGYGIYFPDKFNGRTTAISLKASGPIPPSKDNKVTNNRAELWALINALDIILKNNTYGSPIIIISDSSYCLNIMNKWIWSWYKTGEIKKKKNQDLLAQLKEKIEQVMSLIVSDDSNVQNNIRLHEHIDKYLEWNGISLYHQHAHLPNNYDQIKGGNDQNTITYELWLGNKIADELANKGHNN